MEGITDIGLGLMMAFLAETCSVLFVTKKTYFCDKCSFVCIVFGITE
jgi:hypothetical protein